MTEKGQKPTAILRKYLATDDLSVEGLMSCSGSALGKLRADRLFELLRFTWLSQRYWGLSIIASLVAGTRLLGEEWWTSKERSPWPLGSDLSIEMSPDEVLFGPDNLMHGRSRVLTHLEYRIAEEVAVQAWGLPIDYVDLNSLQEVDRLKHIPPGVYPGDRLVLAYDPGCVVDVVVENRPGNELGTHLDVESWRWSVPAEVSWAWCWVLPQAALSTFRVKIHLPTTPRLIPFERPS